MNKNCEFTNDGLIATTKTQIVHLYMHQLKMPPPLDIDLEYEYKVKILKNPDPDDRNMSIGIDDAKCLHLENDFAGKRNTKNYGIYGQTGSIYSHNSGDRGAGTAYGIGYGEDDVITMKYNPYRRHLSFSVNDRDQGIIKDIYGDQNLKYRFCVFRFFCGR